MHFSDMKLHLLDVMKSKKSSILVVTTLIAMIVTITVATASVSASTETVRFYAVRLGDETIAYMNNAENASAVIDGVKNYYATEGAESISVSLDPMLTSVEETFSLDGDTLPEVTRNPQEVIDYLMTGGIEEEVYTIQPGDTLWEIATSRGMTNEEVLAMNPDLDMESFLPGETIKFSEAKPLLTVTVQETVTSTEAIPYDTVTEESDELYKDEVEVKTEGVDGTAQVTTDVVKVNGKVTSSVETNRTIVAEPVTAVMVQGTKTRYGAIPNTGTIVGSGALQWPIYGTVSEEFGAYRSWDAYSYAGHEGIDILAGYGAPICAADGGTVTTAGWSGGYGYTVVIDHGNGMKTLYAHNSSLYVNVGDQVAQGSVIAAAGSTGSVVNPRIYLG